MRVCPNCNESFGDDLNFCDVDGTRLERHPDVASTGDRSRAWSFLGAGLLIGALALSAASIIFFPKARVTPTVASSLPSTGTSANETPATSSAVPQPEMVVEEALAEELPPVEVKKKDKLAGLTNANANVSVPDPKAVALEPEDAGNSSKQASEPAVSTPVVAKDPEPAPARPSAESRESEKEARIVPVIDPKKDPKAKSKDSGKDASKKKDNGKDNKDKKKGGFFGVFKKIFGKD